MKPHFIAVLALCMVFLWTINPVVANTEFDEIDRSIRLRQYPKAVELLGSLVRQNNAKAEFILAGFYRAGKGVKKSLKKAQNYYEKAAQHGLAKAQYTLATLLSKKPPSKQNQKAVLYWYQQAAAQGYALAQKKLKRLALPTNDKALSHDDIFALIRTNNVVAIAALIESGVSIDIKDAQFRIPLQVALLAKHQVLSQKLLKVTSLKSINFCTKDLPLHLAISHGYDQIAYDLIDKKSKVNAVDSQGSNALIIATRRNNLAMIKRLLKHKSNPLRENNSQRSAVHLAQTLGYTNIINEFKRQGFELKAKKTISIENKVKAFKQQVATQKSLYKGWPLMNVAALLGDSGMVLHLINTSTHSKQKDPSGMTALHRASASGHLNIVKILLENNFKLNDLNKKHQTPLFLASQAGHREVVKYLLQKRAKSSIYSSNKSNALAEALAHEHFKVATLLIANESNQAIIEDATFTAIKLKQQKISLQLLKKLKQKSGVDKNARNLLWHAASNNLNSVVDLLLLEESGLINGVDNNGYSPLAQSIKNNVDDIALLLIKNNAPLNQVTKEKNSLLILATLNNNRALVSRLLNRKASLDLKNSFGNTALMMASKNGFNSIVQLLLTANANTNLRDNNDKNAYQLAVEAKQAKSAELIKQNSQLFNIFN